MLLCMCARTRHRGGTPYGTLRGKTTLMRRVRGAAKITVSIWLDHQSSMPVGSRFDFVLLRSRCDDRQAIRSAHTASTAYALRFRLATCACRARGGRGAGVVLGVQLWLTPAVRRGIMRQAHRELLLTHSMIACLSEPPLQLWNMYMRSIPTIPTCLTPASDTRTPTPALCTHTHTCLGCAVVCMLRAMHVMAVPRVCCAVMIGFIPPTSGFGMQVAALYLS